MKMTSLIDGIFWGVFLILLGAWFMVRRYVPVHVPVIRIIVAVFFVYLGVRVLVRGPAIREKNTIIFSDSTIAYSAEKGKDYNVIFSRGDVDLTDVVISEKSVRAEVNVVFGSGTLRINPGTPVRVSMSSAFGTVEAPDGRSVAFGESEYRSPAYKDEAPALEVHANAVFGKLTIVP